jgi:Na+/H+ antiporter NhaD/arsenite permease-like protein
VIGLTGGFDIRWRRDEEATASDAQLSTNQETSAGIEAKLRQLLRLKEQKLITEEEYSRKRTVAALTLGVYARNQLARRMGRDAAYDHAGNVAIAVVAGAVGYAFSQRAVFLLVPVFAVLAAIAVLSIPAKAIDLDRARDFEREPDVAGGPAKAAGYSILFKSRPLVVFGLCAMLFHFANAALLPLVGQKLAGAFPKEATAMISACIVAAQLVMLPIAILKLRLGPLKARGPETDKRSSFDPKATDPTASMFFFFSVPEIWKTSLTCLIGLATLIGIMMRPFRWNEAIIAMVGGAVLLLLGLIAPADAFLTLIRDWNRFPFFLGMMGISALAEAAGLFDWLAVQAARLAGQLKGAFDIQRLPSAEEATKHKGYFRYTCCVLAAVAVAYVVASAIQLPLSLIALSGAVLLLVGALSWRQTSLHEIASRVFLVHLWVYRRNAYRGPGDRGHRANNHV